eukprot:TRINITY_DN5914_c0_g1_i1.p1 TRINITY_DN5914_c0_g1~~TRINITY_DN5914_c0_g1_i1.p1  ORF type:complete len:651 (+),score=134.84 TRINITY_DN5914_c0_g1_i1:119-1954(+)
MPGFCSFVWLSDLSQPRAIDIAPNGDILIVEVGNGKISVNWEDDSGAVQSANLYQNNSLSLTHGVKYFNNSIYASSDTTVYQWHYPAVKYRTALATPTIAVADLPESGHIARTILFDSTGRIIINIGSGSNIDDNSSRARVVRSVAPYIGQTITYPQDFEVVADGTRNEVGLRFDMQGRLWGVENGLDDLGVDNNTRQDFGDIHLTNPGEEVNLFLEEDRQKHYGYPYCWSEGLPENGNNRSFPEGLGAGTQWATRLGTVHTDLWCRNTSNVVPPRFIMQAHSAPLDILFYYGTTFPSMNGNVAFVAKHGSWDRPLNNPSGRSVSTLWLNHDGYPVREEPLFWGPPGWDHRPVGLAVGACKAYGECLFVTDDRSGMIIAIAIGEKAAEPPVQPLPPTASPVVKFDVPITVQLAAGLNLTYTFRRDDTITFSLVKKDSEGWIALGFNSKAGMMGTQTVIGYRDGGVQVADRFLVNSFDENVILATMNNSDLIPWTMSNASVEISAAGNNLTFTRPVAGLNLTQQIFVVAAWHVFKPANFWAHDLPKHTGAGSFPITFYGPGTGRNLPDPLVVSLSLVGILLGLSLIVGVLSYCLCLRKKPTAYEPFVEGGSA